MSKVPIFFSTITGNAFILASAIRDEVPEAVGPYNIRYINDDAINRFDTFVLTYWCNHGTADDDTLALLKRMKGKNIIILGTLGAASDSPHADKVRANVESAVKENNNLVMHYLCRGSIDLNRTSQRLRIPEGEKGHLSQERFERQKESLGHPDKDELEQARIAVRKAFSKQ